MTVFEAVVEVLQQCGGGPLHYREITRIAMEKGYMVTQGLTPWYTVHARLRTHIRDAVNSHKEPLILQTGKGMFALAKQSKNGILKYIAENDTQVKKELLNRLLVISSRAFERMIVELLSEIGFDNIIVTKYAENSEINLKADLTVGGITSVATVIQVKRYTNTITAKVVRELRGSLTTDQRGLIITMGSFANEAIEEAAAEGKTPISLVDSQRLIELLIQYQIAVSRKTIEYFELDLARLEEMEKEE